jgi:hypothetical protein
MGTDIQSLDRLLGVLRRFSPEAIILVCASSEVFGRAPREKPPITRNALFIPRRPMRCRKSVRTLSAVIAYNMCVMTHMFTHAVFAPDRRRIDRGRRDLARVGAPSSPSRPSRSKSP